MSARRIAIVIDELNLHGFDPRGRCAIGDALERELTRLFADSPHLPDADRRIEQLAARPILLRSRQAAAELGERLAERVRAAVMPVNASAREGLSAPVKHKGKRPGSRRQNGSGAGKVSVPARKRESVAVRGRR